MVLQIFIISIFVLLLIGVPISFAILGTVGVLIVTTGLTQFAIIPTYMFSGINNFALMAIPFFILSGDIMNEGKLSESLIGFCRKLLGHIRGGLGYAAVLACMMFACLSGAAVATVSAIGGIMLPMLIKDGYDAADSTAVVCTGACTGPIIPPSIPMVVYGVVSGVSVTKMFIGGIVPGLIAGILVMGSWYLMGRKKNYPVEPRQSAREILRSAKKAVPAMMMPVIMMGGMLTGIFTPTEAGVIAVVYAFIIARFVNHSMPMKTLRKVMISSAKSSAVVLLVVGATNVLASVITVARIPQMIGAALTSLSSNPLVILCVINVILLVVGLFVDTIPAVTLMGPIFLPIITNLGIDPVAFGVILVFALVIGLVTPPVGSVLYIGCGISEIRLVDLLKSITPIVFLFIAELFLLTVFPQLITALPNLIIG